MNLESEVQKFSIRTKRRFSSEPREPKPRRSNEHDLARATRERVLVVHAWRPASQSDMPLLNTRVRP
jgi:hypothetical protein